MLAGASGSKVFVGWLNGAREDGALDELEVRRKSCFVDGICNSDWKISPCGEALKLTEMTAVLFRGEGFIERAGLLNLG